MSLGGKILMLGATGQVALPLTLALAKNSDAQVWGVARFSDQAAKKRLEDAGVKTVTADLAKGLPDGFPDDFDYVLNFSVLKSNDWDYDMEANTGVGAVMFHCRKARAFLDCSSTAVYAPKGHEPIKETDPLGDNHRIWDFIQTYSICRIATEAVVRFCAKQLNLPTTIARLNVPYGDNGGWPALHIDNVLNGDPIPVHVNAPSTYNPINDVDIALMVPKLLEAASVPTTIVNWGGDDPVSIEDWSAYIGKLVGKDPVIVQTDQTIESVEIDTTKMHQLIGHTTVGWQDGFRSMIQARHPELKLN